MTVLVRAAVAISLASVVAQGQARVTVGDGGPGASGRLLQQVLAGPHRLVEPDTAWFTLRRGEQESAAIVVLGRTAAIAGNVEGDVVVVGGDLFVRPGAHIAGRAIAIGGAVYPSALAVIARRSYSFRDNTFAITPLADGYRLDYLSLRVQASRTLVFPGVFGLRTPAYDRVNGASISFGPTYTTRSGRLEADLVATYRTDLGKIDPSIDLRMEVDRRSRATLVASRGTFSNDAWIWSDLVNALSSFVFGRDTRNYYRADRAELTVLRSLDWMATQIEPFAGVVVERAWSVGPTFGEARGPWSIRGRTDSLGMWRPNPAVFEGSITSAIVGTGVQWSAQGLTLHIRSRGEIGRPAGAGNGFAQITSDAGISFPAFGDQEYDLEVHWVTSPAGTLPPQRFAYLGGAGTLPFHKLLEFGGDELLHVEQRYSYPLLNVSVGLLGTPTLLLRHRLGSAGVGRLPHFEQVIGVGVLISFVRGEIELDPASQKTRLSAGLSFTR